MKNFIQSRKFKMLLIAALALQTLLVLSVIDGFGYKEFNPGFRYGSDPVQVMDAEGNPVPTARGPFVVAKLRYHYHALPIIRDILTLIIYGSLIFYFVRTVKHRGIRIGVGIFTLLIALIACLDARINYIAAYYPEFRGPIEHQTRTLFDPDTDISPIIRVYDAEKEREIQGAIFAVPIPFGRGKSYQGYTDFEFSGRGEFTRFVPEDFFEYFRLKGIRPMQIQYFTWQYPGCELAIFDMKNQRQPYFDFDSRETGIAPIEFFFEDLISRYHKPSLPLDSYANLFKYAFESPYYTTAYVDDPYFLIERAEYEKARDKINEIDDPAVREFLEEKLNREN